jgi:hypothetical protein
VAEPNDHLRRARERVESPNASGQPLSRQEFAELVNAWVNDNTNPRRVIETDAHYIGQGERGRIRWPHDRDRRAGFHTVLCAATDAELGFRRLRRRRSTVAEVDRQQFIRGDAGYGGGLLRDAVIAPIRYCAEFLNARCSDRVRTDLLSAVGVLARITGFMAFDAHAHDDARRMFRLTANAAVTAGPGEKFARARVVDQLKLASLAMMRESRRFGESPKRLTEVAELTHRIGSAVVV